jgi:hypothetical protein
MSHEMARMVVGSGLRLSLSQVRGRSALCVHCIAASLPGRTMPQNESEGNEEVGWSRPSGRDSSVTLATEPQNRQGSRTQGSQRSSRSTWGPGKERPVHGASCPFHTLSMSAGRLHRPGCYWARSVVPSLCRVTFVERPVHSLSRAC